MKAFLIMGLWGFIYSRGLYALQEKLQRLGIVSEVWSKGLFGYINKTRIFNEAAAAYLAGKKIVLIGHSMGADEAVMVAGMLDDRGIPVEFLGCIDPTRFGLPFMPGNVKKAICFVGTDGGLGDGVLVAADPAHEKRITHIKLTDIHVKADNSLSVHRDIIAALS